MPIVCMKSYGIDDYREGKVVSFKSSPSYFENKMFFISFPVLKIKNLLIYTEHIRVNASVK